MHTKPQLFGCVYHRQQLSQENLQPQGSSGILTQLIVSVVEPLVMVIFFVQQREVQKD